MTQNTWIVRADGCCGDKQEAHELNTGLFGIKNTSDYDVEIRHLTLELNRGRDPNQSANPQPLYRITSVTDGQNLTVLKNDTAAATLPSQVKVVTHATVALDGLVSNPGQLRGMQTGRNRTAGNITSTLPFGAARLSTAPYGLVNGWYKSAGNVQPLVLREGEGVAWVQINPSSAPSTQYGYALFRNQSTNDTYSVFVRPVPAAEYDNMLVIFNGSGSGVILELLRVESHDVGVSWLSQSESNEMIYFNSTPGIRIVKCVDLLEGESVSPAAFDTANSALSSNIQCLKHPVVVMHPDAEGQIGRVRDQMLGYTVPQGEDRASLTYIQNYGTERAWQRDGYERWAPGDGSFPRLFEGPYRRLLRTRGINVDSIVLKKGECFAIVNWFRHERAHDTATVLGSFCQDDQIMTSVNYNFACEFTTAVTTGTSISASTAPSAATIVVG